MAEKVLVSHTESVYNTAAGCMAEKVLVNVFAETERVRNVKQR